MVEPMNDGRSPDGAGLAGAEAPEPSGLGPSGSIPNADEMARRFSDPRFLRERAVAQFIARVGHVMRMARLHRGYTVDELAAACGVTARIIRRLERGEYRDGNLAMLAEMAFALDVEISFQASAIEARSDATGTGAAEGESAVPNGETPQ